MKDILRFIACVAIAAAIMNPKPIIQVMINYCPSDNGKAVECHEKVGYCADVVKDTGYQNMEEDITHG